MRRSLPALPLLGSLLLPVMTVTMNGQTETPAPAPAPATAAPAVTTPAKPNLSKKRWPKEVTKVEIPTSDGQVQPAMWYAPDGAKGKPRPLLVALHTWSSTYESAGGDAVYAEWCISQGWAFVHPHFRGPNNTPEAMGSDRAVEDIVEAVKWARKNTSVDESRIYLIGVSGGGHMALQMAAWQPHLWAGVSAWCGISDIAEWHAFHTKTTLVDGVPTEKVGRYAQDIEKALGGSPATDERRKADAWKRSPLSSLSYARNLPLDICAGINDGRTGSVPFTHSLRAYNAVVRLEDRLPEDGVNAFYESGALPSGWKPAEEDPSYGAWKPVFRKVSGSTRVTIFEGGHEIVHQAALNWLEKQRKGQSAVWNVRDFIRLEVGGGESGK